MLLTTVADSHRNGIKVVPESYPELSQKDRLDEGLQTIRRPSQQK